jgi:hypothetical protein
MIESTHPVLLSDDIHVQWEKELLNALNGKPGKNAHNWNETKTGPESRLSIHMLSHTVEHDSRVKRGVHPSPEEDENVTDENDQKHDPVPLICVHENIQVDGENCWVGDIGSEMESV